MTLVSNFDNLKNFTFCGTHGLTWCSFYFLFIYFFSFNPQYPNSPNPVKRNGKKKKEKKKPNPETQCEKERKEEKEEEEEEEQENRETKSCYDNFEKKVGSQTTYKKKETKFVLNKVIQYTKYCSSSVAVVRPPLQELCSTAYIPRSANPVTSGCCQWR